MSITILPQNHLEKNHFQEQINCLIRQKRELINSLSTNYGEILKLHWEIASLQSEIIMFEQDNKSTIRIMRDLDHQVEIFKRLQERGQK